MFDVKDVNRTVLKQLNDNVNRVKQLLETIHAEVPFFMAGGSVFGVVNKSNAYSDIDVYFYNDDDMNKVKNTITSGTADKDTMFQPIYGESYIVNGVEFTTTINTATQYRVKPIQFVFCEFGEPEKVLDTFDLNVSRISYSYKHNFAFGTNFGLAFAPDVNVTHQTLLRFFKYTTFKQVEFCKKTHDSIIETVCKNPLALVKSAYTDEKIPAFRCLNSVAWATLPMKTTNNTVDTIVKMVLKYHKKYEAVDLLKELNFVRYTGDLDSPELTLAKINSAVHCSKQEIEKCKLVYPEMFV